LERGWRRFLLWLTIGPGPVAARQLPEQPAALQHDWEALDAGRPVAL